MCENHAGTLGDLIMREQSELTQLVGIGIVPGIMIGSRLGVNTAIAMTLPSALIIAAGIMLCSVALISPVVDIAHQIHLEFFQKDKPLRGTCCALLLGVAASILNTFNAMAVLSLMFSSLPLTPFTLPFMCAVGASSLALLGLSVMTRPSREQVVNTPTLGIV